jgi:hypothetical protein
MICRLNMMTKAEHSRRDSMWGCRYEERDGRENDWAQSNVDRSIVMVNG